MVKSSISRFRPWSSCAGGELWAHPWLGGAQEVRGSPVGCAARGRRCRGTTRTCSCDITESSRSEETNPVLQDHPSHICCVLARPWLSKVLGQEDPDLSGRYRAEDLIPFYLSHLIQKTGIIMLANLRRL